MKIALECTEYYPEHNCNLTGSSLVTAKEGEGHFYKPILDLFPRLQCFVCFYHVFLSLLGYDSICWVSDSVRLFCHMHWVVLPTVEHMCTYFCTMSADRGDISELQIWMWLIPSLCLKPPMLFSRDGTMLPAFLAVKLPVTACMPVLLFGLAGSLESMKCYHWEARCEVNLPCTA